MVSRLLKRVPIERLMDLKVDYAFKQLFGTEKNKEITVVFLNAVLNRSGHESIRDLSFTSTEAGGEYEEDKQSRLDILAVTNDGKRINVEIQFTNQYDMIKRSIYYWAGIYRRPMKKRMAYRELYPVIAINILNFNLFQDTKRFHTSYHLYEDQDFFLLTDVMEFHFLEMPKLISDWKQNLLDPWNDLLARWMLLLGIVDHRNGKVYEDIYHELEAIAMKDSTLKQAFQGWDLLSATEEEIWAYEARLKQVLDAEAAKREAELREKEAVEKAVKEGLERGIQQGIEQGKLCEKVELARKMLQKGMEKEVIAEITGLEPAEISRIIQEMK